MSIEKDLIKIEDHITNSYKDIWKKYYKINHKGRLFRSKLFLLSLKLFSNTVDNKTIKLASAFEIIHIGSLIHDEIIEDNSLYANNCPSYKWDNKISILTGDYILSRVITFLLKDVERNIFEDIFNSVLIKCEGGILKIKKNSAPETEEKEYLEVIEKGTASLTSTCCSSGVKAAGIRDNNIIISLGNYGRAMGMAFQIMEDTSCFKIIQKHNKQKERDFSDFAISLPFIYTFKKSSDKDKKRLYDLAKFDWPENDRAELLKLFDKYGAVDYSIMRAKDYISYAGKEIKNIKDCQAKESLLKLGEEIITGKWWTSESKDNI